jgi:GNAT superfamily N-acetyltransferase
VGRRNVKAKGHSSRLIEAAENEAIKRGCKIVDLSTFAFQAPEFYRKNGYEMFGELENAVSGYSIYFFRKNLK